MAEIIDLYARRIFQKYKLHPDGWAFDLDYISEFLRQSPWTRTLTPGMVRLVYEDVDEPVNVRRFGNTPVISMYHANGTSAAPEASETDDSLGQLNYGGADAFGEFHIGARLEAIAEAGVSSTFTYDAAAQAQIGGDSINGSWATTFANFCAVAGLVVDGDYLFANTTSHGPGGGPGGVAKLYRYSISGGTWTALITSSTGLFATPLVKHNGHVYFGTGGEITTVNQTKVFDHNIALGTSATIGNSTTPGFTQVGVRSVGVDPDNNLLYVGMAAFTGDADVWQYNIGTTVWTKIANAPGDLASSGNGNPDQVNAMAVKGGFLYIALTRSVANRAQVWRWNGTSWTLIGGTGGVGPNNKTSLNVLLDIPNTDYVYVGTSDGEVWEWNTDTSVWTKVGGDSVSGSWSSTNAIASLIVHEGLILCGLVNASSEAEIWKYELGVWSLLDNAPSALYDAPFSMAVETDTGKLWAGFGSGDANEDDVWFMGILEADVSVHASTRMMIIPSNTLVPSQQWYSNGDIAFGLGLDGMFWDESARKLGILDNAPARTLHVGGTDGIRVEQGSPVTPALGDIYIAASTGILTWHDGTAARRTAHAPAAITDNRLVRGDGGSTGIQQSGITVDDSNNITGVAAFTSTSVALLDTGADHSLVITLNENLSANRTLQITVSNANRTLAIPGNATISGTNTGDVTLAGTPDYLTIAGQVITRGFIDLATDVTGDLPYANLTAAGAASKLLGRGDSGAGDWQEITLGTGLTMTGTTLSASGGGGGGVDTIAFEEAYMTDATASITSEADLTGASISLDIDGDWLVTATFSVDVATLAATVVGYLNVDGSNEAETLVIDAIAASGREDHTRQWIITIASQPKTVKLRAARTAGTGTVTVHGNSVATHLTAIYLGSGVPLHAAEHESGGDDEIDVTGLSGLLADPQTPDDHASTHSDGGGDAIDVTDLDGYPGGGTTFLRDDGTFAAPAGGGAWALVGTCVSTGTTSTGSWAFTSNVTEVDFIDLAGYTEIMAVVTAMTKGTSGVIGFRVSIDNGANFLAGTDYNFVDANGVVTAGAGINVHSTSATAARYGFVICRQWNLTTIKTAVGNSTTANAQWQIPTANALTAVRIYPASGGNITGGSIKIYGR